MVETETRAVPARLDAELADGVLTLTMCNPSARNALAPAILSEGIAQLARVEADEAIRAVVLRGEGEAFCGGGDIRRLLRNRAHSHADQREGLKTLHRLILAVRGARVPVIAAVEGAAAGAGFSLALACEMVVASRAARFIVSHVKLVLSPDGGATYFLGGMLPRATAAPLVLLGRAVTAERLHALGLVSELTEPGAAGPAAHALALELARGPAEAIARIKRLLGRDDAGLAQALEDEEAAFMACLAGPESGEGLAAFLEKRPARW